MSQQSFAAEAKKIADELKAEEERARKVASEIERKKRALLERGAKHYATVLASHHHQAIASLERASKAVSALGAAPAPPSLDAIPDPAAFADACEAHDKAVAEHTAKVSAVLLRCARECQALHRMASDARREGRDLGIEVPEGVAFVLEHVRRHARYGDRVDRWLGFAGRGESEMLSVADIDMLIEALHLDRPEPQAPNPEYPAGVQRAPEKDAGWIARGWARIGQALADDPPTKPVQTQTDRDAQRVMQRSPEEQRHAMERQQGIRP